MKQSSTNNKNQLHLAILKQMATLATSGFGLVAALAWNGVIQELVNNHIKPFLPKGSGLLSLFIYAVLITTLAVIVTYNLTRIVEKLEEFDK
jgi:uncharacterized membrane protein (DUF106 family)